MPHKFCLTSIAQHTEMFQNKVLMGKNTCQPLDDSEIYLAIKVMKYRYNRKKKRTGKNAGWQRQGARKASIAGAQAADAPKFPDLVLSQKSQLCWMPMTKPEKKTTRTPTPEHHKSLSVCLRKTESQVYPAGIHT